MLLWDKKWKVRAHTFVTEELDVSFEVEKSTKREPNKCSLRLYNLTPEHRRELEQLTINRKSGPGRIRVEIEAGYAEGTALIFRGDLRTAITERDGPDLITTIEGEDGGRASLWGRVNRGFPPGTAVATVLQACVDAMGVGLGNLREVTAGVELVGGSAVFTQGTVVSGSAPDELARLLRSMGLRYSIQNGVVQVQRRNQPLQGTAVVLSPSTGLVGRPSVNADGTVKAQCQMIPDVYPGRQVQFRDVEVAGTYRVEKAKYTGDTHGDPWYIDIEAEELVPVT